MNIDSIFIVFKNYIQQKKYINFCKIYGILRELNVFCNGNSIRYMYGENKNKCLESYFNSLIILFLDKYNLEYNYNFLFNILRILKLEIMCFVDFIVKLCIF